MGKYNNVFCVLEKHMEDEPSQAGEHNFYIVRCRKNNSFNTKKWLKICYPNVIEKGVCNNENAIHAKNRYKTSLGKENWYKIRLNLSDEQRDYF